MNSPNMPASREEAGSAYDVAAQCEVAGCCEDSIGRCAYCGGEICHLDAMEDGLNLYCAGADCWAKHAAILDRARQHLRALGMIA